MTGDVLQGFLVARRLHSRSHSAEGIQMADDDDADSLPEVQ